MLYYLAGMTSGTIAFVAPYVDIAPKLKHIGQKPSKGEWEP
jgi:hypothetical protein